MAGYSLGEVSAFLSSIAAQASEVMSILAYRTQLMLELLAAGEEYDLIYVQVACDIESMTSVCQGQNCAICHYY